METPRTYKKTGQTRFFLFWTVIIGVIGGYFYLRESSPIVQESRAYQVQRQANLEEVSRPDLQDQAKFESR